MPPFPTPSRSTFARLGWVALLALALLASREVCWARAAPDALSLTWYTVDGGGGVSQSAPDALRGVAGQPDAGLLSSGGYTLRGGFLQPATAPIQPPTTTPTFTPTATSEPTPPAITMSVAGANHLGAVTDGAGTRASLVRAPQRISG